MDWRVCRFRLKIVLGVLVLSLAGLWGRLFLLQAVDCDRFKDLAATQHTLEITIPAERGRVYDRNGEILAISVPGKSVFVDPSEITDLAAAASGLASALALDAGKVRSALEARRGGRFVWIKRQITPDEEAAVRAECIDGVHIREERKRLYPCGRMLAQVIGFTGVDEQGLSGIEFACEKNLKGRDGYRRERRDALRRTISSGSLAFVPAVDGNHVVLTVDANIQDFLEEAVERCYADSRPKAVTGIVMSPQTGDILALAQRPTFDPDHYRDYAEETWRLRAVTDSFEPGSMFKPFVFAGALDEGTVKLGETIFCENGAYRIGGRVLHDHYSYGNLSALNVVVKSSNIGMAKIGRRLGPASTYAFLRAFGFGRSSGLGIGSEASGYLERPERWSYYTMTSVPMGHEISVTAVQMAAAFSVFANGGYLVKPRILRGLLDSKGRVLEKHSDPEIKCRTLSEQTARTMLAKVLREVVTNGTGRLANLEDYAVAGKTGTAQKLVDGHYSHSKYVSSFICTGPVESPRAVVLIVVDEPSAGVVRFGGTVAAPYAAQALKATLDYVLVDSHRRQAALRWASAESAGAVRRSGGRGLNAP
ncbi:MAG: penicillin-binding protein 2 [Planctomycetes bacterium]|nr:penicillin-binding protein 2 [Planctomycetota bacterium]